MNKNEFRRILLESRSSFRFLGAEDGTWLGVDDNGIEKVYLIRNMDPKYKKNCIKYLEKQKVNIQTGMFLEGAEYDEADLDELIRLGCEAMEEKIQQLSK